jgi:hypothetical protein
MGPDQLTPLSPRTAADFFENGPISVVAGFFRSTLK